MKTSNFVMVETTKGPCGPVIVNPTAVAEPKGGPIFYSMVFPTKRNGYWRRRVTRIQSNKYQVANWNIQMQYMIGLINFI